MMSDQQALFEDAPIPRWNRVHFSSMTVEWPTPRWLFFELNAYYRFDLDVCATPENALCARFFTKEQNGLNQEWEGTVWVNPPYSRDLGQWVAKAREASIQGCTVVMLLPARTDCRWFHDIIVPAVKEGRAEIWFIKGRLKFNDGKDPAPFPSMIVEFN